MAFDRHVIDGKERLVWTCRAFDFWLFANPPLPFIRTGRCVAAAPRLAILPTDGEDIRTAAEKPSEQGNLVFDCRIPIDEIAGFFRRDTFDSSGLLTRCRLQGLDLGYDLRTLAFSAVSRVMSLVILMFVRIIVESGECRRSSSAA